jgi:hypothetical protein
MKNFPNILFLILWVACLALSSSDIVHAKALGDIQWQKLETKYTIIRYQSLKDLKKFNKKVDYSPKKWSLKRLFSNSATGNLEDNLKRKVDGLYKRAQEILDMRKKANKVLINIYPNKNQLHVVFRKTYKRTISPYDTFSPPRAWYVYESNTIHIHVNDLRAGMLAHEMAHSIIDHYLLVRPPKATAEILARYVDSHL